MSTASNEGGKEARYELRDDWGRSSRRSLRSQRSQGETKIIETASKSRAEFERRRELRRQTSEHQPSIKEGDETNKSDSEDKDPLEDADEHFVTLETLCKRLNTDKDTGLSDEQHAKVYEEIGPNELTPPPKRFWLLQLLDHLTGFFSLVLWAAAFLCFIAYGINPEAVDNLYIGIVLAAVVLITGLFSYYQDASANAVMEGFKNFLPEKCIVIRNGRQMEVVATNLVPGDLVQIEKGQKIPADLRMVTCDAVKVDNSSLTGETEPLDRVVRKEKKDSQLLEAKNVCFYGTLCVRGSGAGIVFATGDRTTIGSIAKLAADASNGDDVEAPINQEINYFIKIISAVAISLGIIFLAIGFGLGLPPIDNIVLAIGIIVANVPEGLLATVTVALTLTAQRMAHRKVLVKSLESVETLGSTNIIASDKTGTLTQNIMTLQHLWFNNTRYDSSTFLEERKAHTSRGFDEVKDCLTLCTTAEFSNEKEEKENVPFQNRSVSGDASETALVKFAEPVLRQHETTLQKERQKYPAVFKLPFNSTNKFMLHICTMDDRYNQRRVLWMKGAPERVWSRCSHILVDGKERPKEEFQKQFDEALFSFMNSGERVLGLCMKSLKAEDFPDDFEYNWDGEHGEESNFPHNGYTFLGLTALIDPPRPAVPGAIKSCKTAGIQVIMVTGDHPDTAEAIAKMIGIITKPTRRDIAIREDREFKSIPRDHPGIQAQVVTGVEVSRMSDEALDRVLDYDEIVFARTSPANKYTIVKALQDKRYKRYRDGRNPKRIQNIVAVTGDGVNDSPALSQADIGVAMGIVGSDVAKDAADMILLNDNFASIVDGVEEGRLIFENLKKSIAYTLSSNIPEVSPFLVFIILRIPLPLTAILIILIDLGTDMYPAISLAYETKESDIMSKPPRDAHQDRLVTRKLISFSYGQIAVIQALAGFTAYFIVMRDYGFLAEDLLFASELFTDFINDEGEPVYFPNTADSLGAESLSINGNSINLVECNITDSEICHKPDEALRHAQTAFFVAVIICKIADLLACRTRRLTFFEQGFKNRAVLYAIIQMLALAVFLLYVPPVNAIGTRNLRFVHWCPAFPFAVLVFSYDELRKFLVRSGPKLSSGVTVAEEYLYY